MLSEPETTVGKDSSSALCGRDNGITVAAIRPEGDISSDLLDAGLVSMIKKQGQADFGGEG